MVELLHLFAVSEMGNSSHMLAGLDPGPVWAVAGLSAKVDQIE
jgi:hypothetical protein